MSAAARFMGYASLTGHRRFICELTIADGHLSCARVLFPRRWRRPYEWPLAAITSVAWHPSSRRISWRKLMPALVVEIGFSSGERLVFESRRTPQLKALLEERPAPR